ncbi:MAG: hypothetical protein ACJZ03_01320 [Candidatus Neomarinimicrobiota bacterium]|tara:strand:- start:3323 stop:3505 length:183 start_codon:yes stop_codon:yes gene_type:complete
MEKMSLTEEERKELKSIKKETEWYKACDKIKKRRNGQYPNYLSRQVLEMYQVNFPPQIED